MDALVDYESAASGDDCAKEQCAHDEVADTILRPPPPPYVAQAGGGAQPSVSSDRLLMHVFIPVSGKTIPGFAKRLLGLARLQLVGKSLKASFCEHDSLHISISRPCAIDVSRIPEIIAALTRELSNFAGGSLFIEEFVIALLSQSNSRLFIAAPVSSESTDRIVLPLIRRVDSAFSRLSLPLYYENPLPHMSFASTSTTAIKEGFPDPLSRPTTPVNTAEVHAGSVVCEIGHRQFSFPLQS